MKPLPDELLRKMDALHLCLDTIKYARSAVAQAPALIASINDVLARHRSYITEHFQDLPEIRDWVWTD